MKKIILLLLAFFILESCVVSTAGKVVKTVATAGYKVVKGTVNGISWTVSKAKGKIDPDRLDGTWKIVGVYKGTYEDFENDPAPESTADFGGCGSMEIEFNSKREKFRPVYCSGEKENFVDYKMKYGKNPSSNERENYIQFHSSNYITVVDASRKTMVLEGGLVPSMAFNGYKLYLLEKK